MRAWKFNDILIAWSLAGMPIALIAGILSRIFGVKWILFAGAAIAVVPLLIFAGLFSYYALRALHEVEFERFIWYWAASMPLWLVAFGEATGLWLIAITMLAKIATHLVEFVIERLNSRPTG